MARLNRGEIYAADEISVLHVYTRCVRRAFLCGEDPVSGRNFDHRKRQIQDRLEWLAGIFAIDVMAFAILSNHFHLVLRTRPDIANDWSDEEVARRWWALFPKRKTRQRTPAEPTQQEIDALVADKARIAELRSRLGSVSWLMRCLCENIARQANAEDEVTGRFFEARFKSVLLDNEAAVLACMAYVDLNPVRARLAETPETSEFTSVYERIRALRSASDETTNESEPATSTRSDAVGQAGIDLAAETDADASSSGSVSSERQGSLPGAADRWLSPVELAQDHADQCSPVPFRASNRGCLPCSLATYLRIVDWTGRQIVNGKQGRIPADIAPILDRLGMDRTAWVETVRRFGRRGARPRATAAASGRNTSTTASSTKV